MKKVKFIISTMGMGGAERVVSILSKHLLSNNIDVEIITLFKNCNDYNDNVPYRFIGETNVKKHKLINCVKLILRLRKIIKEDKSSMIISFLYNVNIITLISLIGLKNKVIISERNDPYNEPSNWMIRNIRNISYRLCDGIVFQTEDAKKYFNKKIQNKGIIIPNPIKSDLPNRYDGERKKEIVTLTRLHPQKNLKMLIDSFIRFSREYQEYKLIIYGEGELRKELEDYIKQKSMENKIFLPGFENKIHNKIYDCTMFVLSSNYEGMSNAMLEAMAIGLPTISTNHPIGGAKMMITNYENGILTPVGDTEALYKSMKLLINDVDLAERLSVNGTKIKEELNVDKIYAKWIDFIKYIQDKERE